MKRLRLFTTLLLAGCSCSGAGPTAGGATPYVRCAMREPPVIDANVGALHLRTSARTLTIEGASPPLRIAAFRGAALADEPIEPALDAITAAHPTMQIVIGSLGDDAAHVETLLRALAGLDTTTIVVMGGRDHARDLDAAMAALPADARARIVDASGLRRIVIGGVELVVVAGAPEGRYARDDDACGVGAADVDAIATDVGEGSALRFIVGFAAPSPLRGVEGAEAGSAIVADLAARVGAHAGVFAWPDVASTTDVRIAPPLVGPPTPLADGSRLRSGIALVELGSNGMRSLPTD